MPGLMILWTRPEHLELEDVWARSEVVGLGVVGARIALVQPAVFEYPVSWRWMLELEFDVAAAAQRWLRSRQVADWLGDLRQLGTRPTVVLVGTGSPAGPLA